MSTFEEYLQYDGLGLAELVRRGQVQPEQLVESAIARIEQLNPALNAVIDELFDRARQAARGPLPAGPFTGVPYLIKDMVAHGGTRLTLGSAFVRDAGFVPEHSHEVIARTERAGFVFLGKTNASEFGLLPTTEPEAYGPTANPWALDRSPGGSSGGSAAAVAAGMVPLAHGNDGGGSIRIPASACGVFGFKPSRGRNPGYPDDSPDGITVEHCLSRSVRDSAALLDVTRGPRPGDRWWAPPPARPYLDETGVDPPPLHVAFSAVALTGQAPHPDCSTAVHDAATLCEQLGHHVEQARPEIDGHRFNDAFAAIWSSLAASLYPLLLREVRAQRSVDLAARTLGSRLALDVLAPLRTGKLRRPFEPRTRQFAAMGAKLSHAEFYLVATELQRMAYEMARFFETYDVWLTPVLAEPPLRTGALDALSVNQLRERIFAYAAYTPLCNAAGLPAMSVPLHWNGDGLPIGLHFAAGFGQEGTLFQLAGQLERARPWADRRPPLDQ